MNFVLPECVKLFSRGKASWSGAVEQCNYDKLAAPQIFRLV